MGWLYEDRQGVGERPGGRRPRQRDEVMARVAKGYITNEMVAEQIRVNLQDDEL